MSSTNAAAWITGPKVRPLEIKPAEMGVPESNQILVKNHALAVNPLDSRLQATAMYPLNYPDILGHDVAGEVVEVGPDVTSFKIGDRVMGQASGFATKKNTEKGFQKYTILETVLACRVPDSMSYENAVVLPLGLSTAAAGLYNTDLLNLQRPTVPAAKSTDQVVLVWGGASSVGSNAIQLLTASGYEVVTTASPSSFDLVKALGASHVVDYNSPSAVADLLAYTSGKEIAGAFDAVGKGAAQNAVDFVAQSTGKKLVVASVLMGDPVVPEGVEVKKCFSPSIRMNGVGEYVYRTFIQSALDAGLYKVAPKPLVAGKGLESLQDALDLKGKGISQKIVVAL